MVMTVEEAILCHGAEILASEKMQATRAHRQHGATSVFEHCVRVAALSLRIARRLRLPIDERAMIRGALLHDYFLYDWHERSTRPKWHGVRHPRIALENACGEFELSAIERNIIRRHMFPLGLLPPAHLEGMVVSLADKLCAVQEFAAWRRTRAKPCGLDDAVL